MKTRKSISNKLLLSAAAVTTVVGLAGVGTLAGWSTTVSDSHTVATGTFSLAGIEVGDGASNFVPGDSMQRLLTINNDGNVDYGSLGLRTWVAAGDVANPLVDGTDDLSLRIAVDRCDVAWTDNLDSTFDCDGGTLTAVVPDVAGDDVLNNWTLPALLAGDTDNLRVTISLPSDNEDFDTFNTQTVAINYTVSAAQRAGEAK